ncbi:MAG: hypothetical protein V7676_11825 [Parasphingorhabdus sp.]|uniref:hypothetical protein n=1 Tax=Parasphingorhabdus sp. TaxID=2709688 RepID=UPI003002F2E5
MDISFILIGLSGLMLAGCGIVAVLWIMFVVTRLAYQFSGNEVPKAGVAAVILIFAMPVLTFAVFFLSLEIVKDGPGPALLGLIPAAMLWVPLAITSVGVFRNGLNELPDKIS